MSFRGGRGGGGAGRGGLKGATWEHDEDLEIEARKMRARAKGKTTLFPEHPTGANVKKPQPLTAREKRQVRHFKNLQEQIHRGPLYTQPTKRNVDNPLKIFGEDQFNAQYGTDKKANMDPFTEGVETYIDKYAPKKNVIPKLSGRPFSMSHKASIIHQS
jgi:DNA-directed RNA polymerase III subunit RPC7